MENVIQGLLEIEEKAKEITRGAEKDAGQVNRLIEEKAQVQLLEIEGEAKLEVGDYRRKADKDLADRLVQLNEKTDRTIKELEESFRGSAPLWQKEIVERILKL